MSVAQGCCEEAARAGHDVTLLLALPPTGHASDFGSARLTSLNAAPPYSDIPARLIKWLEANPQDILILNGCEQADAAIPYLPTGLCVVYGVHDTADRYFTTALRFETEIAGIIAVAETVAKRFRCQMKNPDKLHVVHNGTAFPASLDKTLLQPRFDDLVFLGGDNPVKGAHDLLALWPHLIDLNFRGHLHWFGHVGDAMRARISSLPASARIKLHGRRPRKDIFEAAGRSKVVLMLSRVEPFGMATVECMGMGCTVVAWDIDTGTKEIMRPGDGALAPLGDYHALALGATSAIELHGQSFIASTTRVREKFSEAAMWLRYERAFDAILNNPSVGRALAGQIPPSYRRPIRLYQLLPARLRAAMRLAVGRSPRIGYALRNFRGK